MNGGRIVYALIEFHHLDRGESTSANQGLAKEIREKGRKDDQAGHIIARSLGGKMERDNLFPISRQSNMNMYHKSEKDIATFIRNNNKDGGRAYLRVQLCYGDSNSRYPERPRTFLYSYVLFTNKSRQPQGSSQSGNRRNSDTLKLLSNAGVVVEKSRTKICPNRVPKKKN